MLRVGSAKLGIGPAQTMVIAERLYTQGKSLKYFVTFGRKILV